MVYGGSPHSGILKKTDLLDIIKKRGLLKKQPSFFVGAYRNMPLQSISVIGHCFIKIF